MTDRASSHAVEGRPKGDLGRRITQRRTELGLSRQEAATRAGMAPAYLQYLEERPTADPGAGTLLRLAGALKTTVGHLTGGDTELPPGLARAARTPRFTELTEAECRSLLSTHGVGRLAVATDSGPVVVPVNYSVVDGGIVFRTEPGTTPAQADGDQVAFEADRIDEAFSEGWSVLVRGPATTVTDPDEVARLEEQAFSTPWAGGRRELWLRIEPVSVTGRRITVA
ncbi:nitroimidazol reductase NimA-like FMN-containing flavoprotein (pyridoxamine 5'-phosphate oxidase superfamily) [Streptomyces luteogriseus]|uniref:helix-turn-helix domain-containing protein n=1 Tax=Streptomyces luteogriseus TaxID=68233 RepID=UPI00278AA4E0|nr:pyridoxamine 5'-phosphate oxidase family protein [Streptomyces luteogriseus]MDQ0711175.1 nitroimidazol reductase NimA-like FMN-containing flavoprotein (pyridoxamine 5'-phosphate oxidase superfamily) [Streptomyces luteogriseus]